MYLEQFCPTNYWMFCTCQRNPEYCSWRCVHGIEMIYFNLCFNSHDTELFSRSDKHVSLGIRHLCVLCSIWKRCRTFFHIDKVSNNFVNQSNVPNLRHLERTLPKDFFYFPVSFKWCKSKLVTGLKPLTLQFKDCRSAVVAI